MLDPYDALARVYDKWVLGFESAEPGIKFYQSFCDSHVGPILYLSVGTGRLALPLAERGKTVIGVDLSKEMLNQCSTKAAQLGLQSHISLFEGDLKTFRLPEPVELVILPMRGIGHLTSAADRLALFESTYSNLKPGGLFVFDHQVSNIQWAREHDRECRLMYFSTNNPGLAIWDTYIYNFEQGTLQCCVTIEDLNAQGVVTQRQHCEVSFSWIEPGEVMDLAARTGFSVEALWGDFGRGSFCTSSPDQVWVLKKTIT